METTVYTTVTNVYMMLTDVLNIFQAVIQIVLYGPHFVPGKGRTNHIPGILINQMVTVIGNTNKKGRFW